MFGCFDRSSPRYASSVLYQVRVIYTLMHPQLDSRIACRETDTQVMTSAVSPDQSHAKLVVQKIYRAPVGHSDEPYSARRGVTNQKQRNRCRSAISREEAAIVARVHDPSVEADNGGQPPTAAASAVACGSVNIR